MGELLAIPWCEIDALPPLPLSFEAVIGEVVFLVGTSCARFVCSVEAAAARAASGHDGLLAGLPPFAAAPEAATGGVGISVRR